MSNKMNYILDFFGVGNLSLGLILGLKSWIIDINYPLIVNLLKIVSLFIGIVYVTLKVIRTLKDWRK